MLAQGTMVLTQEGHYPIEELVGKVVHLWEGTKWARVDDFHMGTADRNLFTVSTCAGETVTATADHLCSLEDTGIKPLRALVNGDRITSHSVRVHGVYREPAAYLKGYALGRTSKAWGSEQEDTTPCRERLVASFAELMEDSPRTALNAWLDNNTEGFPMVTLNWDLQSKLEFVAGLLDARGRVKTGQAYGYTVASTHKDWLLGLQMLLHTLAVNSAVNLSRPVRGASPESVSGVNFRVKASWRLTIAQHGALRLSEQCVFTWVHSFAGHTVKRPGVTTNNKVVCVESVPPTAVYGCTGVNQFALTNGLMMGAG
jgi:hypothetical protein